jgi:hypothetical protein
MQSFTVMDALRDALSRTIQLSALVQTEDALHYLRFGVARRLEMMWHAYRSIILGAHPDRKEPLTSEESIVLTRDLNVIYMNLRGALDNLCWALLHEFAPAETRSRPSKIGLFLPCLVNNLRFATLAKEIAPHQKWDLELKDRRDPVAHRIALTLPPQVLNTEEAGRYKDFVERLNTAMANMDFDGAEDIRRAITHIGTFVPVFMHDPKKRPIPIYPTVPEDVGHVVDLVKSVDAFMSNAKQA